MNPDTDSLLSYIEVQRRNGIADGTIYQSLVAAGWPAPTVQQLLYPVSSQPLNTVGTQSEAPARSLSVAEPPHNGFFHGRLSRLGFLMALVYVLIYFVVPAILTFAGRGSRIINMLAILMGVLGVLAVIPITISIHIRRWHDFDKSGWLTLLGLLPFVGLIMTIVLLFAPGTSGPNKYGSAHPKSLSPKAIFGLSK